MKPRLGEAEFEARDQTAEKSARTVDRHLVRALALGAADSREIERYFPPSGASASGFQRATLSLTSLSVLPDVARGTLERLRAHQRWISGQLGRPVSLKTAALDLLEQTEPQPLPGEDGEVLTVGQLIEMAFHDHLTGLYNYRFFLRAFESEAKRAKRYHRLLTLVILDLDCFKSFNDRYGHEAGNGVLVQIATLLRSGIRETDLLARYGGEEFAFIFPETPKHQAAHFCENLRASVEAATFEIPEHGPVRLSASLGLATLPRDAHDAGELLARTDRALYAAKAGGRNRVSQFQPEKQARLCFTPQAGMEVRGVSVVGDFNGWDREADPMSLNAEGAYERVLHLVPGRYGYKFVLNGTQHLSDPRAGESLDDGYGGKNAVLWVR